jgi:hypothetical protein
MAHVPSVDDILARVGPELQRRHLKKQIKSYGKGVTPDGRECILILADQLTAAQRRELEETVAPAPLEVIGGVREIRAQEQ